MKVTTKFAVAVLVTDTYKLVCKKQDSGTYWFRDEFDAYALKARMELNFPTAEYVIVKRVK